jgi:maltose/moltooligosaccharide transporter
MHQTIKPSLSFWQIWNMSFGFFGIQFGFALQGGFMSRIFQTLGAENNEIPLLWIAAPLTGLIIQPVIGYMSDRTWTPLGRRRPYFLAGAILSSLTLVAMPNSTALVIADGLLWVLDASINISMEPFRALVADKLPASQQTFGFTLQSVIIGIGAVVASVMPYFLTKLGVENTAVEGVIPPAVKYSFYVGALVFIASILWTIIRTKEYPPEMHDTNSAEKNANNGIGQIFTDLLALPKTMLQLGLVQFFTWFALFAMWTYATPAITSHVYHALDTSSKEYNDAADWIGVCFGIFNGFAAVSALALPLLVKRLSKKLTHFICLFIGAMGLISIYFIHDPQYLMLSFICIGIAWASILSMPYAILANSIPSAKMGFYMGTFNFFIVIPQIVAASGGLNLLTSWLFKDESIYSLLLAGASMMAAALCALVVSEKKV